MDENKKPRARVKKTVGEGKEFEKHGEGLGAGPVNNTGNYQDRWEQQNAAPTRPSGQAQHPQQAQNPFGQTQRPQQAQNPFGQTQRPQQSANPFEQAQRPQQAQNPFGQTQRPQQSANPFEKAQRPQQQNSFGQRQSSTGAQKQYNSGVKQNGSGTQRASSSGSGGKLLLIIVALVVLFGGGKLSGLFGGDDSENGNSVLNTITSTQQTQTSSGSSGGLGDISNLLSSFLGSSGTSAYDLSSLLGGATGTLSAGSNTSNLLQSLVSSQNTQQYPASSNDSGSTSSLDESVSNKARGKYTVIRGNNNDTVTILVYMCGTDLESQQGMATSDLKEMANATIGSKVNLIVYTGGCRKWRNNVISSSVNQIYQISDGKFECLVKDAGNSSMVKPDTLASFISFGKENFPADRMCLILWDHGGGSVSGYGYDEKVGHDQSMTLAGITEALKKADVKFDFIGFDACLMATVENGLMLGQYADYMIASEETEPGVGWYYTNWLTQLSKNTSMPTIQIGKQIADDFVTVCDRQCRGQATTLSVVDLAELQATIPDELKQFSIDTNELIQNKEYKTVTTARGKTREFAQQSRIDQIDLVDFAKNMGSTEGKSLAKALQSAVKYNKTGGGITHAYGLSIYFPYKRANKVNQMVSTYQAIGMEEEYTKCIQEFASLEVSGQVSAGTSLSGYGTNLNASQDLLGSLLGQGGGYSSYSSGGLESLLGGLYGVSGSSSGSTGSILDLFMGRSMTAENAAEYIMENHFDADELKWENSRIDISQKNWSITESVMKNVFVDDGSGFIDLGCDAQFTLDGDTLVDDFTGTWLSLDGNIMPYYYLGDVEYDNDEFVMYGYAPALLNDVRVNLMIEFINGEDGYIAGAQYVYGDMDSDTQAKMMIQIGKGDKIQFVCDYYDYDGNYHDSYKLGSAFTLGDTYVIGDAHFQKDFRVTYCFTDIYQKRYWTPALQWNEY